MFKRFESFVCYLKHTKDFSGLNIFRILPLIVKIVGMQAFTKWKLLVCNI